MNDMLEAIAQQLEEWFENKGVQIHMNRRSEFIDISIENGLKHVFIDLFDGIVGVLGTYAKGNIRSVTRTAHTPSYDIADPAFPENMFHDVEKILQADIDKLFTNI